MTESNPEPDRLADFILQQSEEGVAVPVMLFGPESIPQPVQVDGAPGSDATSAAATALTELARELDLDLADSDLYSRRAYLLQCGYGQQVLDAALRGER